MHKTTLVCACGHRLKTTGLAPGTRGRCPGCGGSVRTPEDPPADPVPPAVEDEWNWQGDYGLAPIEPPPTILPRRTDARAEPQEPSPAQAERPGPLAPSTRSGAEDEWNWTGDGYTLGPDDPPPAWRPVELKEDLRGPGFPSSIEPGPESSGRPSRRTARPKSEPWWPPRLLYPLRGAEALGMVAFMGAACWVMGTLLPEYCLTLQSDANLLGAGPMGRLLTFITALPAVFLGPIVVIYWIQYLARVLVESGAGEPRPPRPPDRNFDGLKDGLLPWILWLILGAGVGALPLVGYGVAVSMSIGVSWAPALAAILGLVGFPYALMALLMTFLDDGSAAMRPWAVVGNLIRLGASFVGLALTTVAIIGLGGLPFAVAFALRSRVFALSILVSLAAWLLLAWTMIVAMHTIGAYFHQHRHRFRDSAE